MTQALAVRQILSRSAHEVVRVVIGRNGSRALPEYVVQGLSAPIVELPSPGFAVRAGRSVNMAATAWRALAAHRTWRRSLTSLRAAVADARPDLIFNFLEPLTGLAQFFSPLGVPVISIAHQHMIGHPAHRAPFSARADQWSLRLFADLVGCRSWKLALSLYPAPDQPGRHVIVGPPLLRRELFDLTPTQGDYFLVYLVNHGYHEDVRRWHRAHPEVELHCFYDLPGAPEVEQAAPTLTFHRLSGEKFLRFMAGCRGVATTAGFESVSEAAWLGKPLFVVPVERHAEQRWNARDAVQAGLAMSADRFELDRLASLPARIDNAWFRDWVARAEDVLQRVMTMALGESGKTAPVPAEDVG